MTAKPARQWQRLPEKNAQEAKRLLGCLYRQLDDIQKTTDAIRIALIRKNITSKS